MDHPPVVEVVALQVREKDNPFLIGCPVLEYCY